MFVCRSCVLSVIVHICSVLSLFVCISTRVCLLRLKFVNTNPCPCSSGSEAEDPDLAAPPTDSVLPQVGSQVLSASSPFASDKITMRRVKYLVYLSYLGRAYNGFQKQYNQVGLLTVQDVIEKALGAVGFHRVYMTTGSRTDKGVNAYRHPIVVDVEDPPEVASCSED